MSKHSFASWDFVIIVKAYITEQGFISKRITLVHAVRVNHGDKINREEQWPFFIDLLKNYLPPFFPSLSTTQTLEAKGEVTSMI